MTLHNNYIFDNKMHTHVHTYTDSSSTNTGKDSAQTLEKPSQALTE